MAHKFEVGGYLREPARHGGRIQRVVSLTPSGLPRVQSCKGDPYVIRGCDPATEAEWLEQERRDASERRVRAMRRCFHAALTVDHQPAPVDQQAALIDAAAADWLRASGWTVTAPGAGDAS